MNLNLVYIAGPYTELSESTTTQHIEVARAYAKIFWHHKIPTICPHLNTQNFDNVADYKTFVDGGIAILVRCDLVFLLPNWQLSAGTLEELEAANEELIPATDDLRLALWRGQQIKPPAGVSVGQETVSVVDPTTQCEKPYIVHRLTT